MVMAHQLVKDILYGKRVLYKKRIGLGTHQGIEAVVAEVDMEMLCLARLVAVVVELHIFGRIGTGRFELITDAANLALVIPLRLITGIGVFSGNGFSVCISEGDVVSFNRDLLGVALPRGLILLRIGVLCGRVVLVLLRPVLAEFVQIAVQQIRVQGLPRTGEIREVAILDVILCELFIVAVTVVVAVLLHPFNDLLRFHGIAQHLQQVDDLHLLVDGVFQDVLHPFIGLAAHIDEEVAVGNLDDVIRRGLVAVQVNTVAQQHGQIGALSFVSENFSDPVVFGKNGGDNAQFIGIALARLCVVLFAAAGKQADRHGQRKNQGDNFLHSIDKTSGLLKNRRKNTRAAAKPQEPIRKWIDFALVKILFLIRKLYLERNKCQRVNRLCAGQDRLAHGICKRSSDRCGSTGKPQRFQQILANADLAADGAVVAGAVMIGFDCNIDSRGQHDNGQHYGQQARHKPKFLCHGLSSLLIVIFSCSPNRFHRGSYRLCPA